MKPTSTLVVTRVMFCSNCFKNHRPNKENVFVTIGRTHQKYIVRTVELYGQMGFTPHIIHLLKSEKGFVYFTSYCAIDECGCDISCKEEVGKFTIQPKQVIRPVQKMPIKEWNFMIQYTRDSDFYLD